ncbi:MAG: radical SAM protein [bacterium]
MKVLLLNPPAPETVIRDYYCSKTTKSNYLFPPADLVMQSGLLAEEHELVAIDAVAKRLGRDECMKKIEALSPDAVLGLWGAVTDRVDYEFYRELSGRVSAPLFISGEVLLDDPESWLLERPFVKGALLRFVSPGLVDFLETGEPGPDLLVRDNDGIRKGAESTGREFRAGRPRHELFFHKGYSFSFARGKRFATVLTDFGCPFKCGFCVMPALGYRVRPIDEVIEELSFLKKHDITELFVADQCFGADRRRTVELCREIAAEAPGMGFTTFTRADLLDDTLLDAMYEAGAHTLIMGVETADETALQSYGKSLAPDKVAEGFRKCREKGIRTVATFIIGLPEDTTESIHNTMRLACELSPDFVSYNVAVPRSGTVLKDLARSEGLADVNIDPDQGGARVSMRTRNLKREEVARLKKKAVRDFYLRPSYFIRRLKRVSSLRQLFHEAKEGVSLIIKNV